jgi:serine/threonine-protein kinase RsbW
MPKIHKTETFLDTNRTKPLTYKHKPVAIEKAELKLPSRLESIDKAVTEATDLARSAGFDDEALFAIDMAVREAMANAIKHGNLLDETKPVEITFGVAGDNFEVSVRDFGSGFEVDEIPDPTNPENLLKASGRGILFIRTFMDEVEWFPAESGGTIIKMRKKR